MKNQTPLRAIRAKCLDCSAGQPSEVRKCPIDNCALFTYRFGHNPKRKGLGTITKSSLGNLTLSKAKLAAKPIENQYLRTS